MPSSFMKYAIAFDGGARNNLKVTFGPSLRF